METLLEAESTEAVAALRAKHVLPLPAPMYATPVQIVRGQGQFVWDENGKRYLDGFAGVATVSIGHSHPHWLAKIREQMERYFHTTPLYLHPSLGKFAERLAKKVQKANPELEVCFFTNSGSEANELAALIAKSHTGSHEFVALEHSYHGRTLMAMALTGQSAWRHSTPYGQAVSFAKHGDVEDLERTIKTQTSGRIAAFFAEPINGVGGVMKPGPDYFKQAYEVVRAAGGLCVADEVQTGVGRTGSTFLGIEHWGAEPDIVTMAKGLGNGYPIGAVITTAKIAASMKGKLHYNTFGGGPVQMAAAGAVLDVLESEKLDENAHEVGGYLIGKLAKLGEARGMGLMIGLKVKDAATAARVLDLAKEAGLLIGKGGIDGDVLRIKPPLCLTKADADFLASTLESCLRNA